MALLSLLNIAALSVAIVAQTPASTPPNSYPHEYEGQPAGDYSPAWQNYFEVTEPLPNITFDHTRNFAGNIGVQREGHPNNTLFFWAAEKSNGSLTAEDSIEPWGIWLNGGPGSSSMTGFFWENGPYRIQPDTSITKNNYSWNTLADYIWVDQPVGVGYSTADTDGYIFDEDQMGRDFMGFLSNLVKVFPALATRPLYLTGESYAGTYIPYIMKTYFGLENPPVNIAKFAIGNGVLASRQVAQFLPVLTSIKTYPQLIGYDQGVYNYFEEQSNLCGYNVSLTYPQDGLIPSVPYDIPNIFPWSFNTPPEEGGQEAPPELALEKRSDIVKRNMTWLQANGTIDPFYRCDLMTELRLYAFNYSTPYIGTAFDFYDMTNALSPPPAMNGTIFLGDARTRKAIHAPTSKDWVSYFTFPFGDKGVLDPSPEPMVFLTELASNASSEIAIQNTTFGGIQGFTKQPSTPWYDDSGVFAGIIHQERNWTYALLDGAGHLAPMDKPEAALTFFREFILGNNATGLVADDGVVGGENATLARDYLRGSDEIFTGSGSTQGSYTFPTETRSAWDAFMAAKETA
ncbi:alpha/beta-hydrolase [Cylindrobasidium torrendii FP15055 ss-10]|uniref:Carboxypeptidase n=1 Tax=Cylindrobasidium torrendii FP15055 ss-10 TaxID=1314674 RepID=A0A0D7BF10_9AGAR|nr:alpha/beta-hydrolase [Cylindrobasidium torrendii FP15055 ss-10]